MIVEPVVLRLCRSLRQGFRILAPGEIFDFPEWTDCATVAVARSPGESLGKGHDHDNASRWS